MEGFLRKFLGRNWVYLQENLQADVVVSFQWRIFHTEGGEIREIGSKMRLEERCGKGRALQGSPHLTPALPVGANRRKGTWEGTCG